MLGSHLNMFIWQGILSPFFLFSPLVKLPLATCKGACEGGARWDRRAEAACGSLLEEGRLEARRVACSTDSLSLQRSRRVLLPGLEGRSFSQRGSGALPVQPPATAHPSAAGGLGHFHGGVAGSCYVCVPSPAPHAEVEGGSVLTSPCQNPVGSSGMRAGGRTAAKGAVFLL